MRSQGNDHGHERRHEQCGPGRHGGRGDFAGGWERRRAAFGPFGPPFGGPPFG
ncbi:PadR family transcriptional regulator, partial [Streptomyces inhibens]